MGTVEEIALALDGVREGHNYRCLCPVHGGRSLSITEGRNGRPLLFCHVGCTYAEVVAALDEMGLIGATSRRDIDLCNESADRARSIDAAGEIYCRSQPAGPVETYLRSRAITLPVPKVVRFLPQAPHRWGWYFPAMVAPVVGLYGAPLGIHMTYLKPDGSGKYPFPDKSLQRETRGVIATGSVRLARFDPSRELALGEGVETMLSVMQLFDLPAWATLSTSGLRALELPVEVRNVVIAIDNDWNGAGQTAALSAYTRWKDEGRKVRLLMPPVPGTDFNDVLRGA